MKLDLYVLNLCYGVASFQFPLVLEHDARS